MLGVVEAIYGFNWKEAERLFRLAMAHEPVPAKVLQWYGYFYFRPLGRAEEAIDVVQRSLKPDPLNTFYRVILTEALSAAGKYEDAAAESRRLLELDENSWSAYGQLAGNLLHQGKTVEALPLAEKAYSLAPWNILATALFAAVLRRTGHTSRAEELLQPFENAPGIFGAPRALCIYHYFCGEIDEAVDWAEKMIEQRDAATVNLSVFRSTARWPALAKMMNLPELAIPPATGN
jgi:tetratricopeptide (TPR) repeat protein